VAPACWSGRIVIALEPVRIPCPSAERVLDFFDLWRHGTHALWFGADGSYRIARAYDVGARPWQLDRFPEGRRFPGDGQPAASDAEMPTAGPRNGEPTVETSVDGQDADGAGADGEERALSTDASDQ